ncbi:MAG TPA: hypothetical protein VEC96_09700 [Anaerolineae bacterium]|nr:hypothetical protein [Anaerolineae bacterium]
MNQQPQLTILTQKNSPLVAICKACRNVVNFSQVSYKDRPAEGLTGITEIGLECPKCNQWYTSHYLNDNLLKMQANRETWDRQTRRAYEREFKKLQFWVKHKKGIK